MEEVEEKSIWWMVLDMSHDKERLLLSSRFSHDCCHRQLLKHNPLCKLVLPTVSRSSHVAGNSSLAVEELLASKVLLFHSLPEDYTHEGNNPK